MKLSSVVLLFAIICLVNGMPQLISKSIKRVKDGVTTIGETAKVVGITVIDAAVGELNNGIF
jgi:hypothetical protein